MGFFIYFDGDNISKLTEVILEILLSDLGIKITDKDIGWKFVLVLNDVTNTDRFAILRAILDQHLVVHCFKGNLGTF